MARMLALAPSLKRVLLPALLGVAVIAVVELAIYVKYHPTFWQRTTWLMRDPYRGEIFDRVMLYTRLSRFEDSQPNIISVGDSSGFFGVQSKIVNRYTHGVKYLSLNTGANYSYIGYKGLAEYMLKRSKGSIKYVVVYFYPQIAPVPYIIQLADLAPIVHDTLVGPLSYITPPSAFLSPYAKYQVFANHRFRFGDEMLRQTPALELGATVEEAQGWLPEYDVRIDRIRGELPYFSDKRTELLAQLGLLEQSSIYHWLDEFNKMAKSYGANLAVAFAPVAERGLIPGDPHIPEAEAAMARFSRDNPDVKFLMPYITLWSPEKFGTANHVSREYTFLSSYRMGKALERLITDPDSIPPYTPSYPARGAYEPITYTVKGAHDPEMLNAAMAYYLYASTLDEEHKKRISRRSLALLEKNQAYRYMMEDKAARTESLNQRKIKIGFDLSKLQARPIDVKGMQFCASGSDVQWVQVDGILSFTYDSPTAIASEPVRWPEGSHIFIPTVMEDGVRKFDGYCEEPESVLSYSHIRKNVN